VDCEAKGDYAQTKRMIHSASFPKFSWETCRSGSVSPKRSRFIDLRVEYILNSFRNSLENKKTRKEFLPIWFLSLSETGFKSDSLLLLLELVRW
jgi:hypothetical protein